MAKRLTYNEATALWYARHPDLMPLRGTWQAITCSTCGYLDETMEPVWWACPQCLKLVQQPGHLRPVVSLTAIAQETDYPTLQHVDHSLPYVDPDDPGTAQPAPPSQPLGITCRVVTTKRK